MSPLNAEFSRPWASELNCEYHWRAVGKQRLELVELLGDDAAALQVAAVGELVERQSCRTWQKPAPS